MSEAIKSDWRKKFKSAARAYLDFADTHSGLADEISEAAVEQAASIFGDRIDRPGRLSFEQRVALATHTCIRHNYTAYDDLFIEKTIDQSYASENDEGAEEKRGPPPAENFVDEVAAFIRAHRR